MLQNEDIHISVIIPCYNVENKIQKCIQSLKKIQFHQKNYEVIFIDDGSTDHTIDIISSEIDNRSNWSLHKLLENSGSPSKPRNIGTVLAKGEYLFFLDSDDEIIDSSLQQQYAIAIQENACIVRGYLIIDENKNKQIANQIIDFPHTESKKEKIKKIITHQSTTSPSLVKKELITEHSIIWEEDIRVGEDTLFLIDVLTHATVITYLDEALFIYNKTRETEASSTQIYGARELKSHLHVWSEAEKRLAQFDFSYMSTRGSVGLFTCFQGILYDYKNDIDKTLFDKFSSFIKIHWDTVSKFHFRTRYKKALTFLYENKYYEFFQILKEHNLSDNYDLYDYLKSSIPHDHYQQTNCFALTRSKIKKDSTLSSVLDFGCYTGDSSSFFRAISPSSKWSGISISVSSRNVSKKSIQNYNKSTLPFKGHHFDLVYSNQALEHVPDPQLALLEIARVLKKDGLFIGQTSQFNTSHSQSYCNFSIYGFKRLIERTGMKLIEIRPSIDSFSLLKRSYTMEFEKYNKFFIEESHKNLDIEHRGRNKQLSNTNINFRKLMFCGQFCFVCSLK